MLILYLWSENLDNEKCYLNHAKALGRVNSGWGVQASGLIVKGLYV